MKTLTCFSTGLIFIGSVFLSCSDESITTSTQPVVVEFQNDHFTIDENQSELIIGLTLSSKAAADGISKIKINKEQQQRFETVPAPVNGIVELPISKGQSQLQFKLIPVNNNEKDGDETFEISIELLNGPFVAGEKKSFQLTIHDDDTDEELPAQTVADFNQQTLTLFETNSELEIKVLLSKPVAVAGNVVIDVSSDNENTFTTNPPLVDGKLILFAAVGVSELPFKVYPVNNTVLTGHSNITFSITSTEGSIVKGTQLSQALTIQDDELSLKKKGYEISTSHDAVKRFYEYDSKGRIAKVNWETYTPYKSAGTDTYYYDESDRIIKINKHTGRDVHYRWTNGRIEKSDVYQDEVLIQYANYAYDEQGNVAGVEPYYKQNDGSFKRGLFSVYLYFNDGNIYKSLTYTDVEGAEPVLISTKTYENYMAEVNHFPMVEILPNVTSQRNLATSYRVEENGFDFRYSLSYEFNEDGLPLKRTATSSQDSQTTVYHYY